MTQDTTIATRFADALRLAAADYTAAIDAAPYDNDVADAAAYRYRRAVAEARADVRRSISTKDA